VNLATALSGTGDVNASITEYRRAFALLPSQLFGAYVNHEYGFALVRAGRLDEARVAFERMTKEGAPNQAKGFRSLALLNMYQGKFAAATEDVRRAIALDQSDGGGVSEFRDRMYLVTTLDARGERAAAEAAWRDVAESIKKLTLDPGWLSRPTRWLARHGKIQDAQGLIALMRKTIGNTTADSSVARNLQRDRSYLDLAQAEIELASGNAKKAVALIEPVRDELKLEVSESLAAAYAASGRATDAIAAYEELLRVGRPGNELQLIWLESHVALGGLYERASRFDDARRVYSALVDQFKAGDSTLPLLRAAREGLERVAR